MQRNGGTLTLDLVDTDCVSNVYCDVSVYCVFEGESIVSWSIYLSVNDVPSAISKISLASHATTDASQTKNPAYALPKPNPLNKTNTKYL